LAERPRSRRNPADKLKAAQLDFILAMQQLAAEGVPNNPLSVLIEEVYQEWRRAGHSTPGEHDRFRYSSLAETQAREQQRTAKEAARREQQMRLIDKWARKYWLVGTDGKPANWIVAYAEELCRRLSGEQREGPVTLGGLNSATGGPSLPLIGALIIPMADPQRQGGESSSEFKKRVRSAVTNRLNKLDTSNRVKSATPKRQNSIRKPHELDHYKWLLLRRCGWKLKDIRKKYPYVDSAQAIRQGIQRKGALLGLHK